MPDRYSKSKIKFSKIKEKSVRIFPTTIYPKIARKSDDIYIMSRYGDRLDILAYKYYEDQSLWWIIAIANNLNNGSIAIEPGIQIRIPSNPTEIYDQYLLLNQNRI